MRSYWMLLKLSAVNLKASLRSGMTSRKSGRINVLYVALSILLAVCFLGLAAMLIYGETILFGALARLGQPMLLPAVALMLCVALTLMMGLFHTLSRLYFNRDSAWLASLPVTSRSVMAARLTEVCLGELLINAVLLLPVMIMLGIELGGGVGYYLRALVILLMSSALPVAVITLISSALARLTGFVRHRELVLTIGSVLMVTLILGLEYTILPSIPDDADILFFVRILLSSSGLVDLVTSALPPLRWAVHGLKGDWAAFGLYVLVSMGSLAAVVALLGGKYLNVCINQSEQSAKRSKRKLGSKDWQIRSPLMALYRREWTEVLRTPAYALNSLESIIIVPLMAVFLCIGAASTEELSEVLDLLQGLLAAIPGAELMLVTAGIMAFGCLVNPAVSTAVSREGRHHDLYRMMPVEPMTQLRAKMMMGMTINLLSALVSGVIAAFVLGAYAYWLLPGFLLAGVMNYAACAVALSIDALNPRYDWANESQAIKQGTNVLWGMLTGLVLLALPVGAWLLLKFAADASVIARVLGTIAVVLAEGLLGYMLLHKAAAKSYAASEG